MENQIIDTPEPKQAIITAAQKKKVLLYIAFLLVLNFFLMGFIKQGQAVHLTGEAASPAEIKKAMLTTLTITTTIFGFIIGALVSFIPYKGISYSNKYVYFSLLTILAVHGLFFVSTLIRLIFFN